MNIKTFVVFLIGISWCAQLYAQNNISRPISIHIEKEVIPPYLNVQEGSVSFIDENQNGFINANEQSQIVFVVQNTGKGAAYGCVVNVEVSGTTDGLLYNDMPLPTIDSGKSLKVCLPITTNMATKTGEVHFNIVVDEPNGFGTDPIQLSIGTKKFDAPNVEVVSYKILSNNNSTLRKKAPFKLQVLVQNTDQGVADNVTCSFQLPANMFLLEGQNYQEIGSLKPNESHMFEYELQSNANIADTLSLVFNLSESYGKFAKNGRIPLRFGQAVSSSMVAINVTGQEKETVEITKKSLLSDVDINIPTTKLKNDKTFVVIVANENYQQVARVPYALNDGSIFKEYCIKTLGIPEKNIHHINNATGNQLKAQVTWLQAITEVFDDEHIIFYYAGHGIPDEKTKSSYILPVDGIGTDITTGYLVDDLYAALGDMDVNSTTIFMDACFSGSKRESGMLASTRGVALKSKAGVPQGNMVVFSAAQGDETAFPNYEQQHGMFTYYLLKKLQESQGDVTLKELGDYITTKVSQQSIILNSKSQTPCVTPAAAVVDSWQNWKLK